MPIATPCAPLPGLLTPSETFLGTYLSTVPGSSATFFTASRYLTLKRYLCSAGSGRQASVSETVVRQGRTVVVPRV